MAVTVDFTITKSGRSQIVIADNNSGWPNTPTAKVALTLRDKVFIDHILTERSVEVVLYDANATVVDGIGTSVDDQRAGVLFNQYISANGLTLTSTQLYGVDSFEDSFYNVSIESPAVDVTSHTQSMYYVDEMETVGMKMLEFVEIPYDSNLIALKSSMPWHMADSAKLLAESMDSDRFYIYLQFFKRNYK